MRTISIRDEVIGRHPLETCEGCGRRFATPKFLEVAHERAVDHHPDVKDHHRYCPECASGFRRGCPAPSPVATDGFARGPIQRVHVPHSLRRTAIFCVAGSNCLEPLASDACPPSAPLRHLEYACKRAAETPHLTHERRLGGLRQARSPRPPHDIPSRENLKMPSSAASELTASVLPIMLSSKRTFP